MIKHENECVDCGLPCLGNSCTNSDVPHIYCDKCGDDGKIYQYDGEHLCISCIEETLEEVKPEDEV